MTDVPFIPLLGEDGVRPRINVNQLSNDIVRLIETHRYGSCEQFSDYEELSVIAKCNSRVSKVADQEYGEEHALKQERSITSVHSEQNFCSEIELLRQLSHPNIVAYEGVIAHHKLSRGYILMEYCQENLIQLLNSFHSDFDEPQLKCVMTMLLSGLAYLRDQRIIHRDIAPQNLLISSFGMLKIGDFSRAIQWEEDDELECNVGSPGYRAPELIAEHQQYTPAIDMWSVGCIFSELLLHRPLFSDDERNVSQMCDILQLCGSAAISGLEFLSKSLTVELLTKERPENYHRVFRDTKPDALNLLKKFFKCDFTQRIKANKVLAEEYFTTQPVASDPTLLQSYFNYKKKSSVDGPYVGAIVVDQIVEPVHEETDTATHTVTDSATHSVTDVATTGSVTDVATTRSVTDVATTRSVTDVATTRSVTGEAAEGEEDNFSNSLEEGEIPESSPRIKSEY